MLKWLYRKYEVSIIIPTYKNTKFLIECLESVIASAEKCANYEILLGIDHCNDTLEFIQSSSLFSHKHIKVYYFSKNVGPYFIRNSLAEKSKYANILFFDSDDVMMENMVETLLKNFKGKSMLKFKFYNFNDGSDYTNVDNLNISPDSSIGQFLITKKSFFKSMGFFGWKCGADTEFHERYSGNGNDIHNIDVPLFYRRYHSNNMTKSPDTGINSKIREKYGKIIMENRINKKWKNPVRPYVFPSTLIKL
jgi:glycosyltransferase involved in cell wall biosynthesis